MWCQLLQVVILQEKLEEREDEIRQLKLQLQENGKDIGSVEEQAEVAVDENANDDENANNEAEIQTES